MNLVEDLYHQLRRSQDKTELERQYPGCTVMGVGGAFVILPEKQEPEEWQARAREYRQKDEARSKEIRKAREEAGEKPIE